MIGVRAATCFFINRLKKSEACSPPNTRYKPTIAISPREFHWESQSPSPAKPSSTGQRISHHPRVRQPGLLWCGRRTGAVVVTRRFRGLAFFPRTS